MRRDKIDVDVRNVPGARDGDATTADERTEDRPVLDITYDGDDGRLAERLRGDVHSPESGDVDVTYRLTDADDPGVLSVADRTTGEFLLEADVPADRIHELVRAVAGADGDEERSYRVEITDATGSVTAFDERTLLVYDADGGLRRGDSLIPGGVEL